MADNTPKANRKPRIRKTETVRERVARQAAKAEAKTNKTPKRRVLKVASKVVRPLSTPTRIASKPLKLRPVRFVGRVIGRILWPRYFRNSWKELRQVTWPTRRDTWKLTFAVLVFAVVFGLAAAGTDYVLDKIIQRIVFRA